MVLGFLVALTIVYNQTLGSGPWFGNKETGTAVMGIVPVLIVFKEASINAFLDLAFDFLNLFLWSGIGTTPHSRLFKFWFQFQVHLDHFSTRKGRRQGAEHLLIGYQQFLQSGVKVKTLEFLKEILLSMEVASSMFFLFLPISSFGRHRTIVPLR